MKQATSTELRRDSSKVFNAVQELGQVVILHRDRPDMILVSQKHIAKVMAKAYEEGRKSVK